MSAIDAVIEALEVFRKHGLPPPLEIRVNKETSQRLLLAQNNHANVAIPIKSAARGWAEINGVRVTWPT